MNPCYRQPVQELSPSCCGPHSAGAPVRSGDQNFHSFQGCLDQQPFNFAERRISPQHSPRLNQPSPIIPPCTVLLGAKQGLLSVLFRGKQVNFDLFRGDPEPLHGPCAVGWEKLIGLTCEDSEQPIQCSTGLFGQGELVPRHYDPCWAEHDALHGVSCEKIHPEQTVEGVRVEDQHPLGQAMSSKGDLEVGLALGKDHLPIA